MGMTPRKDADRTVTQYGIDDVIDGCQLVKTRRVGHSGVILAVWHGGHTVNTYTYDPSDPYHTIRPAGVRSVGDYETGETSRDDAREAMEEMLAADHKEA